MKMPLETSTSSTARRQAAARRLPVVQNVYFPAYVVWELTLACDHGCSHCGSRAGKCRPNELSTTEAMAVVDELRAMGAREVVLIGGEAYLHPGFLQILAALRSADMVPVMTTGGAGITAALAREMKIAGLARVSVSLDGMAAAHNRVRNKRISFGQACTALKNLRAAGIDISANTSINRVNRHDLEDLYLHLRSLGVRSWQVQLMAPLGRAADRPDWLLQPYDLLELLPRLTKLKARGQADGLLLMPGNNLGYFGPEEVRLRSQKPADGDVFRGCQAGRFVLGIESDGGVKACPSLPSHHYIAGHIGKESRLDRLWKSEKLAFNRKVPQLWGECATCPHSETCRGGCNFTAHSFFGRPGNNPYCHFRALSLQRRGLRERLVPERAAVGDSFDHGLFKLVQEDIAAPEPPMSLVVLAD